MILTKSERSFIVPKSIRTQKTIKTVYEYENSLKSSSRLFMVTLPEPVIKNLKANKTGNKIYERSYINTITGTKRKPIKTNIPNFQPRLPKCFSIVNVKSKSSPAALKVKY